MALATADDVGAGRRRRRPAVDPGLAVVIAAAVLWAVVFGRLVLLRHARFRTIDFDLAIHDQSIWLLSRFADFSTVRGLPVFGHHASFGYFALVPFYWLGAGPNFLNLVQVGALAASAIPIYLLARHRLRSPVAPCLLALAWLAQPPLQWFAWETFHPEVLAIPLLLWAYLCADRDRTGWYWVLVVAALAQKEDVALAVVMIGLLLVIRRRRRLGLATMAVAAGWFAVTALWLVPALAGGKTVYGPLYGDLGDSPGEVARTALTDPTRVVDRLADNDALGYAQGLLVPVAYTPLAAPEALAVGLPQALTNLLTVANFTWDLKYHYQALPMVGIGLGMIEGVARLARLPRRRRRAAVGTALAAVVLMCGLWATRSSGPSPWGEAYTKGYWPLARPPDQTVRDEALRLIGPDDGVSVDYWMTPHVAHRRIAYTFPNPWLGKNYGTSPDAHGDPAQVRWLVLDLALVTSPAERQVYDRLIASGEFTVRLQQGSVVVAERTAPPP